MTIPSIYELHDIIFNENKCVEYLRSKNIFYELHECSKCKKPLKYFSNGHRFRCTSNNCNQTEIPLRMNTFFANSKLPIYKILYIGYCWLKGDSSSSIQKATKHSTETIAKYLNYYRQLIASTLNEEDDIIGGDGIVVQIDESKFG